MERASESLEYITLYSVFFLIKLNSWQKNQKEFSLYHMTKVYDNEYP